MCNCNTCTSIFIWIWQNIIIDIYRNRQVAAFWYIKLDNDDVQERYIKSFHTQVVSQPLIVGRLANFQKPSVLIKASNINSWPYLWKKYIAEIKFS